MNSPTDSEHQDVISRTRHYVHQQGLKTPIGPECLVVGLVRHLGKEKAIQTLIKAGISNPQALFCDKTTPAGETLPPVKPDPALAALLAGPLKPFMVGDMPPKDALDFLLTNEGVAARVDALLQRATPRPAVEEVLGLLTRNFLQRYSERRQVPGGERFGGMGLQETPPDSAGGNGSARQLDRTANGLHCARLMRATAPRRADAR